MKEFQHVQTAHCENGVTVGLLRHQGMLDITEPLAFGLGSGLFYIHLPFMKVNNGPAISFRTMPGAIFKRTCTALNVPVVRKKFRSTEKAKSFLDARLAEGKVIGAQVGVFHLPYFPREYRFHFNAHNIIIYGKQGENYMISDPVMEITTTLTPEELEKVRFARGAFAPKGQLYYSGPVGQVSDEMLYNAVRKGIKRNVRDMLHIPGNIAGVSGIRYTARQITKWRDKLGERQAALSLGQIVRMQEEIGTGGGGFRFLYAAFLEEALEITKKEELLVASELMTKAGDMWRDSAVQMAGIYKGRLHSQADYLHSAEILNSIADIEKQAFQTLKKVNWKK